MKYSFFLTALLLISSLSFVQGQTSPTTEEEYNYVTKGYKIQNDAGLDMKKGYELQSFGQYNEGSYSFEFRILFRTTSKEIAGIMVIAKSQSWGNTYYLCIPHENDYLKQRYNSFLDSWDGNICRAYSKVLSHHLSKIVMAAYDYELKMREEKK